MAVMAVRVKLQPFLDRQLLMPEEEAVLHLAQELLEQADLELAELVVNLVLQTEQQERSILALAAVVEEIHQLVLVLEAQA
jgi:hypothetical protein